VCLNVRKSSTRLEEEAEAKWRRHPRHTAAHKEQATCIGRTPTPAMPSSGTLSLAHVIATFGQQELTEKKCDNGLPRQARDKQKETCRAVSTSMFELKLPHLEELSEGSHREEREVNDDCHIDNLQNTYVFLSFSLCLSRACLGKTIVLSNKWRKRDAFSHRHKRQEDDHELIL
jgi:hypothetical protein